jgi:hypothetical protein
VKLGKRLAGRGRRAALSTSRKCFPTCWRVVPWIRVSATFLSQSKRNMFSAARLSKERPLSAFSCTKSTPRSTRPLWRGVAGFVGRITVP